MYSVLAPKDLSYLLDTQYTNFPMNVMEKFMVLVTRVIIDPTMYTFISLIYGIKMLNNITIVKMKYLL